MMPWFFRWKWMYMPYFDTLLRNNLKTGYHALLFNLSTKVPVTVSHFWEVMGLPKANFNFTWHSSLTNKISFTQSPFPRGGVFFPISEYWRLAYSPKTKNMGAGHDQGEEATYPPSLHHNLVSRPPTSYSTFLPRGFDYISFDLDPHWWS